MKRRRQEKSLDGWQPTISLSDEQRARLQHIHPSEDFEREFLRAVAQGGAVFLDDDRPARRPAAVAARLGARAWRLAGDLRATLKGDALDDALDGAQYRIRHLAGELDRLALLMERAAARCVPGAPGRPLDNELRLFVADLRDVLARHKVKTGKSVNGPLARTLRLAGELLGVPFEPKVKDEAGAVPDLRRILRNRRKTS